MGDPATGTTTFPLIAKTIAGLEEVLAAELETAGAGGVMRLTRAVSFLGDQSLLYRLNYTCRTALRILRPIFHFEVTEQKDFYDRIHDHPWENLIDATNTISIDAVISYTVFTNSQYVAQRAKDAIVDRIREKSGARPSVDLDNADYRINVHLFRDQCTVSLDSSGQSLHRRGYRQSTGPAPINEVLAAGLLQLSDWDRNSPLFDPMCGSGTLLIEAALLAGNIPAGTFRSTWGFMKWRDFDANLWKSVKGECDAAAVRRFPRLEGGDRADSAVRSAMVNLAHCGLEKDIIITNRNFTTADPPFPKATLITNPPYDERIKLEDSVAFYKMIGDTLKQKYEGYTAWIISSDLGSLKFVGLKPSRKITIFNGPLECRFVRFALYR